MICSSTAKSMVYDILCPKLKPTSFLNQVLTKSFRTMYKFLLLNADIRPHEFIISNSKYEIYTFSPNDYLHSHSKFSNVVFNISDLDFVNAEQHTFDNVKTISQQFYDMLFEYVSSFPPDTTVYEFNTHLGLLAEAILDI